MPRQTWRGSYEKQYYLANNFLYGIDGSNADSAIDYGLGFRELLNCSLESQGVVKNRKGFGGLWILQKILNDGLITIPTGTIHMWLPILDVYNDLEKMNTYNEKQVTENDADFDSNINSYWGKYQEETNYRVIDLKIVYIIDNKLYLLTVHKPADTDTFDIVTFTEKYDFLTTDSITITREGRLPIPVHNFENKYYFAIGGDKTYIYNVLDDTVNTMEVYKPTFHEVKNVGYNVMADNPLTWLENKGVTTKKVQAYILCEYGTTNPVVKMPNNSQFTMIVYYTGTIETFDMFFEHTDVLNPSSWIELDQIEVILFSI